MFIFNSFLLGIGLAMDACAVSITNGLNEPKMKRSKMFFICFMFGLFQALMPLIGYFVGHAFIEYIEKFIPFIALGLLAFLGIKMIIDGIKGEESNEKEKILTFGGIFMQAIATSIDALSVGLTIADYSILQAVICSIIIAIVTFIICVLAFTLGKKFGEKLGNKAILMGGVILIIVGIEIFLTGIL